jgi:DNA phosphorothioation-dependent restriction protein DptG
MSKIQLNLRLEESEMKLLAKYAKKTGRTKTDIIREFIRSLKTLFSGCLILPYIRRRFLLLRLTSPVNFYGFFFCCEI